MNTHIDTVSKIMSELNTTSYQLWEGIIQVKNNHTGMYNYYEYETFRVIPIQSVRPIISGD